MIKNILKIGICSLTLGLCSHAIAQSATNSSQSQLEEKLTQEEKEIKQVGPQTSQGQALQAETKVQENQMRADIINQETSNVAVSTTNIK